MTTDREQLLVREFHRAFDLTVNETPTVPSDKDIRLRLSLIWEEFCELCEACGYYLDSVQVRKEVSLIKTDETVDMVEVADALGDLAYVVKGANVAFGINATPVFDEIHRSNMSKVWQDGKVHKNEYGKVVKPPTYSPANLPPILQSMN